MLVVMLVVNEHIQYCSKDYYEAIQGSPYKLVCLLKAEKQS